MYFRIKSLILLLVLLISLPSRAEDIARISNQFIEAVMKQEYRGGYSVLKRWDGSIRLKVTYQVSLSDLIDHLLNEQIGLLETATGLKILRVSENPQLQMVFTSSSAMNAVWHKLAKGEIPGDALCVSQIAADKTGKISKGVILIPVDRASERGKLLSCIVEELTQSMGLINDSPELYPSIFNDQSKNQMITSLDWLLTATLYDPALSPGMTVDEVRSKVPGVITRLLKQGVKEEGERRIRSSELYSLMEIN